MNTFYHGDRQREIIPTHILIWQQKLAIIRNHIDDDWQRTSELLYKVQTGQPFKQEDLDYITQLSQWYQWRDNKYQYYLTPDDIAYLKNELGDYISEKDLKKHLIKIRSVVNCRKKGFLKSVMVKGVWYYSKIELAKNIKEGVIK